MALLPGGFEEATLYARGAFRVYVRTRKARAGLADESRLAEKALTRLRASSSPQGFIKFALQHGYAVHPVYTFGEERTFRAFTALRRMRLALNRLRLPGVLFLGTPRLAALPFLPNPDAALLTVVGPPLRLPLIAAPTAADVVLWHERYCDALRRLFDAHKAQAGCPAAQLELL